MHTHIYEVKAAPMDTPYRLKMEKLHSHHNALMEFTLLYVAVFKILIRDVTDFTGTEKLVYLRYL